MKETIRFISGEAISSAVTSLYAQACIGPHHSVEENLTAILAEEGPGPGREALIIEIENLKIAAETGLPICQDTGTAVVFVELGNLVCIFDCSLADAVNAGISQACSQRFLRPSQVYPPMGARVNTMDNTPAVLHLEHVTGSQIRIFLLSKGAGSENVSRSEMLPPLAGSQGIIDLAERCVRAGASKACPPVIVGIGIGGNLETSGILAKKALLQDLGCENKESELQKLENQITEILNATGIGPQGFGGKTTVMETRIIQAPCHMASLPVTVCIDCHAHRTASCVL
ncbi:MAG: fumarate hydratase [Candidatus Fermentibacteria bacterium]|nr:fumarate hydratase [Candidatus Fermentibacteria bacterium]